MIKKITNNVKLSKNVILADSFFKRLKGLMFTKELPPESSMYIKPCGQIHTFFMKYALDVLYLSKDNVVIDFDENIKPWRIGKLVKGAVSVVELNEGEIKNLNIKVGQALEIT